MATEAGTINFQGCSYQLQYDILSQSVSNNTTTVRLYGVLIVTNNYVRWDTSKKVWVHYIESPYFETYYARGSHTLVQGDWTFTHDANGDLTQNIGFGIDTSFISGTSSANITFPHIDRVAITNSITTQNSNVEGDFSVNYTKYISSYNYKLRISLPGIVELEKIDYNTSDTTFQLSSFTKNVLFTDSRSTMKTSNEVKLGFAVETWNGNTKISDGNEKIITVKLYDANPIFSDFSVADINPTTIALTGSTTNDVINVNGYSNIQTTITTNDIAEAKKQATMSKYRFKIGNSSVDIPYNSQDNTSGTINGATTGVYEVWAIDSRNNSTLVTKQATSIINYEKIYIDKQNCSFVRNDNQVGENAILTLNGTFWNDDFGEVVNSLSVSYKLKKSDSDTWITGTTTITPTINGNSFTFTGQIASDNQDTTWDLDANYNLEVTVSDELSSASIELILNSAVPTMSLDKNGVGIMCAYDSSLGGLLQIGGEKIFDSGTNYIKYQDGTAIIYGSKQVSFSATGGSYSQVNLPTTLTNNNYIVIITPREDFSYFTSISYTSRNRTTTTVAIGGFNDSSASTTGTLDYIIIGKWK